MASLSKEIEGYLKALLAEQEAGMLEFQRSLLSEIFNCVPSQINYVLQTRFTPQNGYLVETRRGGGGYVRIVHIPIEKNDDLKSLLELVGNEVSEGEGELLLTRLAEQDVISPTLASLLKSLLKDRVMRLPKAMTSQELRAHLLTQILANISILPEEQ